MDHRVFSPPPTGTRRRPWPDDDSEEEASPNPKRRKPMRDHPLHGALGGLAEAEEAVARVSTDSPAAVRPGTTGEIEDGEKLDHGVASVDAGRGPGADPGDAGPASSARAPPPAEISEDVFVDDIFGESPIAVHKSRKEFGLLIKETAHHDNWDDEEGYYLCRIGEVLAGRYEILAGHGKGVSSNVVRAKDLKAGKNDPSEVAIKIICSKPVTYKAGKQEISILEKLASASPKDRWYCVRFISSFMHRKHLCLVFESLHMNLGEVLKKFGSADGLKLTAVRAYSKQLFIALKHLKTCGVVHRDIKPDNVLVNGAANVLKLCDFGSAVSAGTDAITPYLVSCFYSAPEIRDLYTAIRPESQFPCYSGRLNNKNGFEEIDFNHQAGG